LDPPTHSPPAVVAYEVMHQQWWRCVGTRAVTVPAII